MKDLNIQHGAPNLSGVKSCPSCKTQVARDAVLCIQCGYNFVTRQKIGGKNWLAANQQLVLLIGGGLAVLALAAAYLFWPEPKAPPPFVSAPAAPAAVQPTPPPLVTPPIAQPVVATTNASAGTNAVAPPPGPTPEELAAQQAEADRAARAAELAEFEAKKAQAARTLRQQLDTRAPLYSINDTIELRRNNGFVDKGTLTSFSGSGTGRVALVATAMGEIGVPLILLDTPSRLRVDPEYREAFIQHRLSTRSPAPPGTQPEN